MIDVNVVLLPRDLTASDLAGRSVVVFDVLRATTTMAAALAAGVERIEVFPTPAAAAEAAQAYARARGDDRSSRILCGEVNCLPPPGFDLGNSPGAFNPADHAGRPVFMSTTNGTRAVLAARGAGRVFVGALVNAGAVAEAAGARGSDVTLLCAGTQGQVSMEDLIGAGAVLHALSRRGPVNLTGDGARVAWRLYDAARGELPAALADADGGRNVLAAGLPGDIYFCARLDTLGVVGVVEDRGDAPPVVRRWERES